MTDKDRKLREQLRVEANDLLFAGLEMSDRMKQQIRQQAAAEKKGRRNAMPKAWVLGTVGAAAAVLLFAAFPLLNQSEVTPVPSDPPVVSVPSTNDGAVGTGSGSGLSELITTTVGTVEEAKAAFGEGLLVPNALPEGFALSEIVTVGMPGEPVRDAIFTYTSGEKTITFAASRMQAAFPAELFTKTQVGGVDAHVFEQPELTELFWVVDGVQFSITGPLTADEAVAAAESAV
ncbi:DUF4367 domain-containing protein [Paenibacillus soyae]|uniref:DUF4367 domain-containing protein n=1 Tax=Paenibacillus soyae TaxID=2969249 RepID=A0A9X2MY45_9BACL|nr:DUF4367 domain-containing protein [Paenibacillus soyae]MCR2807991.1 DUF4367 domain-containing protein [Paenibacillus soyae]